MYGHPSHDEWRRRHRVAAIRRRLHRIAAAVALVLVCVAIMRVPA